MAKDKTARRDLEARQATAATELADLRISLATKQMDRNNVERELGTVRAVAQTIGLGDDPAMAVNAMAGTLAVLWDPFAVLLLLAATRQAPPAKPVAQPVRKPIRRKITKRPAKRIANDNNVVDFRPAA